MSLFKTMNVSDTEEKTEKVELSGETEQVKCLIIGSGPAGYTAAIYAARANLEPVMIQGMEPGGQLTTTTDVENFPGYPDGISGPKMMEDLQKQAERFGTDVRWGMVTQVDFTEQPYKVMVDDKHQIEAATVIIATGASAKYLGLESEEKFRGSGVSACATCDGFFYKNQDVAVVGGGDTACEEALYLAGICSKVYMVVRKDYLRASKVMQERVRQNPKIEILFEHETKEIVGDKTVNGAILTKRRGRPDEEEIKIDVTGFFLAIGHKPNSEPFTPAIQTDGVGYIKTTPGTPRTNVEGVYACGDIQDPIYRQAVTAAGSGCMAALEAERYLGAQRFSWLK